MGGGKGGDGGAGQARKDEQERQAKIRAGTTRINDIFNGQTVGDQKLAAGSVYDPNAKYYNADGTSWTPVAPKPAVVAPTPEKGSAVISEGDERSSLSVAEKMRQAAEKRNPTVSAAGPSIADQFAQKSGDLYGATKKTAGFNDEYFNKQRQNFIDYATPQLDDQYSDANKQLTFSLARSGLTDSSVRGDKASDLQKLYDLNKQKVADDALGFETSARNSVEDARNGLITTLNATGDAEGAANSALARAQALSQPAAYSPLSQLFADFTAGLGTQAAAEKSFSAGGSAPTYTTGLFGSSKNAVKVG